MLRDIMRIIKFAMYVCFVYVRMCYMCVCIRVCACVRVYVCARRDACVLELEQRLKFTL